MYICFFIFFFIFTKFYYVRIYVKPTKFNFKFLNINLEKNKKIAKNDHEFARTNELR